MENVMKKFFAYNPEYIPNNSNHSIKTAKSSSVYQIPPQIQLLDIKNNANNHSKTNYDQERIKTLEEKIIQMENKKNNEKNELFQLIKSNLAANRSAHHNPLQMSFNTPNTYQLPNIKDSRNHNYWKYEDPTEMPNKFKQKLEFGEKMEELRDSITQRLRVFRKLNVNEELKDELIEIKQQLKHREKFLENKNSEELNSVVQEIKSINNIINKRIDEEYEKSLENANVLGRDFNMFKNEIVDKINGIQQKQQNQIKGLKLILNNSNINKDKLMIDDLEDIYGDNKELISPINDKDYEAQINRENLNKRDGSIDEYRKVLFEMDLKNKPHEERLKAEIIINQIDKEHALKESIKERLKKYILEKNEGKEEKMKQIILKYRHIIKKKGARFKGLNLFRKVVYYYIAAFRLSKVPKSNKEFIRKESMKQFIANFENIDKEVKIWLYEAIKVPIQSILNYEYLNINITQSGTIFNSDEEIKEIYNNLQIRIQAILDNLIEKTEFKYIGSNITLLMDMITSKGNYIPRQFLLMFEIARLDIENSVLGNVDDDQRKMILIFYVFLKTLVCYIFIDHNFSENRQRKSSVYKNFKVCASIFYYSIRNYFRKFVVEKNEKDVNKEKKQQKKPKMLDMSYYNSKKSLEKKLKREKEAEEEIEKKLNKYIKEKFQYFFPDTKKDICESIEGQIFPEEELNIYYELARENKFDLNILIIKWVEKLEDIIDEYIKNRREKEHFTNKKNIK